MADPSRSPVELATAQLVRAHPGDGTPTFRVLRGNVVWFAQRAPCHTPALRCPTSDLQLSQSATVSAVGERALCPMASVLVILPSRERAGTVLRVTQAVKVPQRTEAQRLVPIRYRHSDHSEAPHLLSFSGGRSSAAMAFMAAEQGMLRPDRGDAVLFANTSAEHPRTYRFAAECKRRLEERYGLPVFWYEFCTVEDATRGSYRRKASYRLVKPVPLTEDPDGYRESGERMEELIAWQGMLPNPHSRTCTAKLKLAPAHLLLADWLGGLPGPPHAGHHWGEALADPERCWADYLRSGGSESRESYMRRTQHLAGLPSARSTQRWQDYTDAPLRPMTGTEPAAMWGVGAALHVRLIGLRADERSRVNRVMSRSVFAEGAVTARCRVKNQPPGEMPYFPLHDGGLTSSDIADYWTAQDFDLDIPDGAGNCVFCFMKGTRQLVSLNRTADADRKAGRPSDMGWWAALEGSYARILPARNGSGTTTFGFLGIRAPTYADLAGGGGGGSNRSLRHRCAGLRLHGLIAQDATLLHTTARRSQIRAWQQSQGFLGWGAFGPGRSSRAGGTGVGAERTGRGARGRPGRGSGLVHRVFGACLPSTRHGHLPQCAQVVQARARQMAPRRGIT